MNSRKRCRRKVFLGFDQKINPQKKIVETSIGNLEYDELIIATGSKTNFFGNTNIQKYTMEMKSIPQSLNIRSLILENFEEALLTSNIEERNALMNFIIVGGGPTGVELAGALVIKPFSLLVRLFANISAGHIVVMSLIAIMFTLKESLGVVGATGLSLVLSFFITLIEVLVAFLQAYIFTMLSALFIGMAVAEPEHH